MLFERFTERARKVMALANQEARRYNSDCIGPEHVFLGLVGEGTGVGVSALNNLGVDLRGVRGEVEKLVQSGPETVTIDDLSQTPETETVINEAIAYAKSIEQNYVGTEHLARALATSLPADNVVSQVLKNLGVMPGALEAEIDNMLGITPPAILAELLGIDSDTERLRMLTYKIYWALPKMFDGSHFEPEGVEIHYAYRGTKRIYALQLAENLARGLLGMDVQKAKGDTWEDTQRRGGYIK